jgi:tripartite-type tricarboxylate transporter receptor subunit TctC
MSTIVRKRLGWHPLVWALWSACAAAEPAYPSRPIRLVVPFTPGSGTDVVARMIAPKLIEVLGQPVVVDNRPGAGSVVGTVIVGASAPDGHTLLVTSSGFVGTASAAAKLPYDPIRDFAGVTQIMSTPLVIVVAPALGLRSLRALIALARQQPISYASNGVGSGTHFGSELLRQAGKFEATHVPYKGVTEALTDTLAGRVTFNLAPLLAALPLLKDGRLTGLALTTSPRSPLLPDLPTPAEAGVPDFRYEGWYGMIVPAKTPRAIVDRLSKALKQIAEAPDIRERVAKLGASTRWTTPEEFDRTIRSEVERREKVLKAPGAQ